MPAYRLGNSFKGNDGKITISRNEHGIPEIKAATQRDAAFGLGWTHACTALRQMASSRLILQGRLASIHGDRDEAVESDTYIRSLNLYPDIDQQWHRLEPGARDELLLYAEGVNEYLSINEQPLFGTGPEKWKPADTMLLSKLVMQLAPSHAQSGVIKLVMHMLACGVDEKRIREIFPAMESRPDINLASGIRLAPHRAPAPVRWLSGLGDLTGSSWAVSGKHTKSGSPLLCCSLNNGTAVARYGWNEVVLRLPEDTVAGFTMPGIPFVFAGRNSRLAYAPACTHMDMNSYRIEECRDYRYRRGNKWLPFDVHTETIRIRDGREIKVDVYKNEHGVLEGDPSVAGHYLVRGKSSGSGCGAQELNVMSNLSRSGSVREAMKHCRNIECWPVIYLLADSGGNTGYQAAGRIYRRPDTAAGPVAQPGWDPVHDARGFIQANRLPSSLNPAEGYIIAADRYPGHDESEGLVHIPLPRFRTERIEHLLGKRKSIDLQYAMDIQRDAYDGRAAMLMKILLPLLPDNAKGRMLKGWDCTRTGGAAAELFDRIYRCAALKVFTAGDDPEKTALLLEETGALSGYPVNIDRVFASRKSGWFRTASREDLLRISLDMVLAAPAKEELPAPVDAPAARFGLPSLREIARRIVERFRRRAVKPVTASGDEFMAVDFYDTRRVPCGFIADMSGDELLVYSGDRRNEKPVVTGNSGSSAPAGRYMNIPL